jgi:hypothetical protein
VIEGVTHSSVTHRRNSRATGRRRPTIWTGLNTTETELLAAIGIKPTCRVLTRRPLTVAFARGFWVPAVLFSLLVDERWYRVEQYSAFAAATVCAFTLLLGPIVHEGAHLWCARKVKGITPRMLLVRPVGGVAIVEGRYQDARGAALFAAGGLLGTLAYVVALVTLGLLVESPPFRMALLLSALVNGGLLAVNLVPVAPTDGYVLVRSGLWASLGNRADAEARAIRWSRFVLVYCSSLALLLFTRDTKGGLLALVILAALVASHSVAASRSAPSPI